MREQQKCSLHLPPDYARSTTYVNRAAHRLTPHVTSLDARGESPPPCTRSVRRAGFAVRTVLCTLQFLNCYLLTCARAFAAASIRSAKRERPPPRAAGCCRGADSRASGVSVSRGTTSGAVSGGNAWGCCCCRCCCCCCRCCCCRCCCCCCCRLRRAAAAGSAAISWRACHKAKVLRRTPYAEGAQEGVSREEARHVKHGRVLPLRHAYGVLHLGLRLVDVDRVQRQGLGTAWHGIA